MLSDLRDRLIQEISTPEIAGDRCVHALGVLASCRACVEVCPSDAWSLDDDALNLDLDRCDGCGLCAAVCPEGAILHEHEPAIRAGADHRVALAACERADLPSIAGVMPCVHALGTRDLLRLYRDGVRELLLATGDCTTCPRGSADPLERRVAETNDALVSHGLKPLAVAPRTPSSWLEEHRRAEQVIGPDVSRRSFLRRSASRSIEQGLRLAGLLGDERERYVAAGELLPGEPAPGGRMPWVPAIDETRCNGCDACARLCPHQAIRLEQDAEEPCYTLTAARCSGCGLCVDACDQDAVTVVPWAVPRQHQVPLTTGRCKACGAPYHAPAGDAASDGRCRICRQTNHQRKLFQVLDS